MLALNVCEVAGSGQGCNGDVRAPRDSTHGEMRAILGAVKQVNFEELEESGPHYATRETISTRCMSAISSKLQQTRFRRSQAAFRQVRHLFREPVGRSVHGTLHR